MKFLQYRSKTVFVIVLSLSILFGTSVPVLAEALTLQKVVIGLQSTSSGMSLAQKNEYITLRIRQIGVNFTLNPTAEKQLRTAGANNQLIKTIQAVNTKTIVPTVTEKNSSPQYISNINQGWDNFEKGNYDAALANYTKAVGIKPQDPENYFYIGVIYYMRKDFSRAVTNFKKATELDTKFDNAFNNLGLAYRRTGEFQLAINAFNKALRLDPDNAGALNNRGLVYSDDLEEFELALADYNQAISIEPFASTYVNRGYVHKSLGNYDLALADCNRALKLDPQESGAYFGRGNIYRDLKEYSRALTEYNKAIEMNSQEDKYFNNRGGLYYIMGKYQLAANDFSRALQINPKSESARNNLNVALEKLK